jgi:hypothetical protein
MIIQQHGPAMCGLRFTGFRVDWWCEAADFYAWPIGLFAGKSDILLFPNWYERSSAWNKDARGARCFDRLVVHLLGIYEMFVVEGHVFRIQFLAD